MAGRETGPIRRGIIQMTEKLFGTDGIRGMANSWPMNAETALKIGMAAGGLFTNGEHRHRVVIGKDTRLSCYTIERALAAGFLSVGMDVFLFGPLPTPAVAMLTRSLRADIGVMISASHNPHHDNGIKLFDRFGCKLSDEQEKRIEELVEKGAGGNLVSPERLGRAKRIEDAQARYIESVKRTFPKNSRLEDMKIVVDCANGASYKVAPAALWELGADVVEMGVEPDGFNINDGCGSTSPQALARRVVAEGADIGIALDGDADRVLIVDEKGNSIDGDQILGLIGTSWARRGTLQGGGIVSTVMSNLGLERFLADNGLTMPRTNVGDRHVVEHMRRHGFNAGGEQSGHIILTDFSTTGDGLVAALQVLAEVISANKPVSDVCNCFEPLPQVLKNVRYSGSMPLEQAAVRKVIEDSRARLADLGRLVIRRSGTEPVIRVMAEGEDESLINAVVADIVSVLEAEAA